MSARTDEIRARLTTFHMARGREELTAEERWATNWALGGGALADLTYLLDRVAELERVAVGLDQLAKAAEVLLIEERQRRERVVAELRSAADVPWFNASPVYRLAADLVESGGTP